MLAVWQTGELCNFCYHFNLVCLPLDTGRANMLTLMTCITDYLENPVDIPTVIVVIR